MNNKTTNPKSLWIADLAAMTCRHTVNKMVLQFTRDGKSLKPEIKNLPPELLSPIAKKPADLSHLQKLIEEGRDFFLRAYETKTENSETPQ